MNKLDDILKQAGKIEDFHYVNVDTQWSSFLSHVSLDTAEVETGISLKNKINRSNYIWLALAFLLITACALYYITSTAPIQRVKKVTTTEKDTTIRLADGSIIKLLPNSFLEYPLYIDSTILERRVVLKGSAEFDVASLSSHPFKVYNNALLVEVLGTSFEIANINDVTKISNNEGSVKISLVLKPENNRILKQGDVFEYKMGQFIDLNAVKVDSVKNIPTPKVQPKELSKIEETKEEEVPVVEENLSTYFIKDVLTFLEKNNKKFVKVHKKSQFNDTTKVKLNLNKDYREVINELAEKGLIIIESGKCADCFEIKHPNK